MKKIFKYMMVALMAAATLGLAACTEKEQPTPEENHETPDLPTYSTLVNTEWEGGYNTSAQTPQGAMPLTIRWTIDFLANGNAAMMMVFESQAFENTPFDWNSTYTFDPATGTGTLRDDTLGEVTFTVDAVNRTLKAVLQVQMRHEEDGPLYTYGGETTLHQTH